MSGSAAFFHTMAPALVANILTVTFVYCFAKIAQRERDGRDDYATYLWLLVLIFGCMLYGLYSWRSSPRWEIEEIPPSPASGPRLKIEKISPAPSSPPQ